MLNAAEVLPGEVLLDPMCGTRMLLTEAPMHCHVLGLWARQILCCFLMFDGAQKMGRANVKCW